MEPNTRGDLLQALSRHFINWRKWEAAEETKKSLLEVLNTGGARNKTSDDLISRVSVRPSPHCLWCLAACQGHTHEHLRQNPSSWTLLKAYWILGQRAQKSVFLVHAPNPYLHITICPSYSVVPGIWCYGSLSDSFKREPRESQREFLLTELRNDTYHSYWHISFLPKFHWPELVTWLCLPAKGLRNIVFHKPGRRNRKWNLMNAELFLSFIRWLLRY